jgi:uncharacterized membrane protein YoaK (UPF0700 family)
MALPSILLLLAFVGGVFATAAFHARARVGETALDNNATLLGGILAAVSAAIAPARLAALAALPGADHRRRRRRRGRRDRRRP